MDGNQVATMTVDEERVRSVSDYTGELPLEVTVEYYLDGERVEPGDVVGEDGKLEVKFIVKNVTGADQEITFDDGKGGTVTKTVNVPIPMVGSLSTVAPSTFTDVQSGQANMAGDGKGGTKLSFTMTRCSRRSARTRRSSATPRPSPTASSRAPRSAPCR